MKRLADDVGTKADQAMASAAAAQMALGRLTEAIRIVQRGIEVLKDRASATERRLAKLESKLKEMGQ
jgi:hypothetical protein